MRNKIKAVIFDFDYTLADTSKGICKCVNYALEKMDFPKADEDSICKTIGMSLPETFIKLTNEKYKDRAEEFRDNFKEMSDRIMVESTMVFSAVPSVFYNLRQMGIKVAIVSTKYRFRIESVLVREGLSGLVDVIIGGEDVQNCKPDPEGLLEAVRRLGINTGDGLYIGDSIVDAQTALNARMRFAAALTGVTLKEEFSSFEVVKHLENLGQLTEFVIHESMITETQRLVLVPLTQRVWDEINGIGKSIYFTDNSEWPTDDLNNFIPKYLESIDGRTDKLGWGVWIIVRKDDGKIVGDIGFKGKPEKGCFVEMGYGIVPGERGRGYAVEAAKALAEWAFGHEEVERIKADCLITNTNSARVLEKLGMQVVSKDGEYIYWELIKGELQKPV
ncbi:MAG: GNAT family N-acetyltransferase [Bacillota bacterium]|nr:GNAT family N-acetyltransferase [Bacillota bacterium]